MSAPEAEKLETTSEAPAASKTEESGQPATYTEMASNAASNAASTAGTAAVGVKDSVFSMFGGGAKKEKKDDEGEEEDRSGSSKAMKDKEVEKEKAAEHEYGEGEGGAVSFSFCSLPRHLRSSRGTNLYLCVCRMTHLNPLRYISSLWSV